MWQYYTVLHTGIIVEFYLFDEEDTKCLFPNHAEAEPGMETGFLDLQHSSCPFLLCEHSAFSQSAVDGYVSHSWLPQILLLQEC